MKSSEKCHENRAIEHNHYQFDNTSGFQMMYCYNQSEASPGVLFCLDIRIVVRETANKCINTQGMTIMEIMASTNRLGVRDFFLQWAGCNIQEAGEIKIS